MNKTQLVDALTARLGDRRTAASAVDGILEIIVDTVGSGGSVTLTGFGVFEPRARAARVARNPRTGEAVAVAPTTVPSFRPGTAFKALVGTKLENGGTARKSAPSRRPRPATRVTGEPPVGAARATAPFSEEAAKPAKAKKPKATAKDTKDTKPRAKKAKK